MDDEPIHRTRTNADHRFERWFLITDDNGRQHIRQELVADEITAKGRAWHVLRVTEFELADFLAFGPSLVARTKLEILLHKREQAKLARGIRKPKT